MTIMTLMMISQQLWWHYYLCVCCLVSMIFEVTLTITIAVGEGLILITVTLIRRSLQCCSHLLHLRSNCRWKTLWLWSTLCVHVCVLISNKSFKKRVYSTYNTINISRMKHSIDQSSEHSFFLFSLLRSDRFYIFCALHSHVKPYTPRKLGIQ